MSNANLLGGGGGGGGTPGGSDGQVQYNNGGSFGGASQLYWDDINLRLGIGSGTGFPATPLDVRGRFLVDRTIATNVGNTNEACFSITNFYSDGGVNFGEVAVGMGPAGEPYLQSFGGKNLRVNQLGNSVVVGSRLTVGGTTTPTGFYDLYTGGAIGQRIIGAAAQALAYLQLVNNAGTTLTSFDSAARLILHAQNEIRFEDSAGGEYAAIKAPATIGASYTLTLPDTDGGVNELLQTNGSGVLSWVAPGGVSDGDKGDITVSGGGTVWDLDLTLDQIALATASVDFNSQQATNFRFENRTSDPGSPTVGQVWLRTDL